MSRILIFEDTRLMRDSLVDVLGELDHQSVTAENGAEAVAMIAAGETFDVIITDIIMPEMDGIEAMQEIQTMCPLTPIIAVSGGSARLEKAAGLDTAKRLGAVAVLEKPFEIDALLDAITLAAAQQG